MSQHALGCKPRVVARAKSVGLCSLIGEQNVISSTRIVESEANMTILGLILNEVQVSPKGKIRNEVSILAQNLPMHEQRECERRILRNAVKALPVGFAPLGEAE